jgi:cytochrome c oxidase cbb3-type subunit II
VTASSRQVAGALVAVALLSLPVSAADFALDSATAPATSYILATTANSLHRAAPSDNDASRGQALYATYCAACHQANGEGVPGQFPPLKGSSAVNRPDATKHIDVVLNGLQGARVSGITYTNPMPAYGATLNDADVAAIVDYERGAWGNHGLLITPAQVAGERARLK